MNRKPAQNGFQNRYLIFIVTKHNKQNDTHMINLAVNWLRWWKLKEMKSINNQQTDKISTQDVTTMEIICQQAVASGVWWHHNNYKRWSYDSSLVTHSIETPKSVRTKYICDPTYVIISLFQSFARILTEQKANKMRRKKRQYTKYSPKHSVCRVNKCIIRSKCFLVNPINDAIFRRFFFFGRQKRKLKWLCH